jgi:hypothetical protein
MKKNRKTKNKKNKKEIQKTNPKNKAIASFTLACNTQPDPCVREDNVMHINHSRPQAMLFLVRVFESLPKLCQC